MNFLKTLYKKIKSIFIKDKKDQELIYEYLDFLNRQPFEYTIWCTKDVGLKKKYFVSTPKNRSGSKETLLLALKQAYDKQTEIKGHTEIFGMKKGNEIETVIDNTSWKHSTAK